MSAAYEETPWDTSWVQDYPHNVLHDARQVSRKIYVTDAFVACCIHSFLSKVKLK